MASGILWRLRYLAILRIRVSDISRFASFLLYLSWPPATTLRTVMPPAFQDGAPVMVLQYSIANSSEGSNVELGVLLIIRSLSLVLPLAGQVGIRFSFPSSCSTVTYLPHPDQTFLPQVPPPEYTTRIRGESKPSYTPPSQFLPPAQQALSRSGVRSNCGVGGGVVQGQQSKCQPAYSTTGLAKHPSSNPSMSARDVAPSSAPRG
ncbi:uncharacterized protein CLUP02_04231 [Colletotrichum lupini]|uniref:Uncharacterized protein n=1 Tax=Colletotrichum lupini TaxID=145971 RepID=A0A9Q8SJZ7_9PEZI|nr:uncharacterized protein CLUP02_04231 [Colletotrichum lupini]UQC78754.1 hypothetical protein CLUP02_04231 [Colletotrichum lupini]